MKTARHILYYTTAGISFIPYSLMFLAGELSEKWFGLLMKFRRWCFREDYAPRARRPGER